MTVSSGYDEANSGYDKVNSGSDEYISKQDKLFTGHHEVDIECDIVGWHGKFGWSDSSDNLTFPNPQTLYMS